MYGRIAVIINGLKGKCNHLESGALWVGRVDFWYETIYDGGKYFDEDHKGVTLAARPAGERLAEKKRLLPRRLQTMVSHAGGVDQVNRMGRVIMESRARFMRVTLDHVLCGVVCITVMLASTSTVLAGSGEPSKATAPVTLSLPDAIDRALKNNPRIRMIGMDVEAEMYNIRAAKAERMPRVDLTSGATRYRYPTPLTPVVIDSLSSLGLDLPRFEKSIYDVGAVMKLPLYRGGRLQRNITVAELRKAIAEDNLQFGREDLIYNVTATYHKVLQLERVRATSNATVKQLEAHRRDAEALYRGGSVPRLDLIKTDVELGHATQNRLQAENNLENGYELLRNLVGEDDVDWRPLLAEPPSEEPVCRDASSCRLKAKGNRADLKALGRRVKIGQERVKIAQGRYYPDVSLTGEYFDRSGTDFAFKENWDVGVHMSVPLFDGGLIRAEVAREKNELTKVREEERGLHLAIEREVKDAFLGIENARLRMTVAETALSSARENLRVEDLKYWVGAATNTDVIDAQTALQRAETDLWQARFDRDTAVATLRRTVGATWSQGAHHD
jgi:outer membrane protein